MANTYAGISVAAVRLDDPQHKVMNFNAGSGGAWGRRGAMHRFDGHRLDDHRRRRLRPDQRSSSLRQQRRRRPLVSDELKLKDYYMPRNWDWLRKRDLDPNNTPTIFTTRAAS